MHGNVAGKGAVVRSVAGGFAYFAVVFAAGFALGALRVMLLVPRLGETASVLLELPIMLAVSWIACGWVIARVGVSGLRSGRVLMGAAAFALLMLAEFGLSVLAFGRTPAEHLDLYLQVPTLLGLAGQLTFAAFPVVQGSREEGAG